MSCAQSFLLVCVCACVCVCVDDGKEDEVIVDLDNLKGAIKEHLANETIRREVKRCVNTLHCT